MVFDWFNKLFGWFNKPFGTNKTKNTGFLGDDNDLQEVLKKYSIVEAVPGNESYPSFLVVTDKSHPGTSGTSELSFVDPDSFSRVPVGAMSEAPQMSTMYFKERAEKNEIGSSSPSPFTAELVKEYNRDLQDMKAFKAYQKMRFSDGVIAGILLLIKTPVNAGRWFVTPASDTKKDKKIAEFVWKCLSEYQSVTWTQILQEAMLSCDFGYIMFEKVWENRQIKGKTYTTLKKLAVRNPMDVKKWKFDDNGGPDSVVMYKRMGTDEMANVTEVTIPISKLIVLTYQKEFNNITGRSVLRPMYKHWYFKDQLYKIDAIQKERHGIGVPIIHLPINFTDADKEAAETLGKNLRTNERAHVVLPAGWEMDFAELKGQPVDALKSIDVHDKAIRESVLAGFIGSDKVAKEEDLTIFLKATRFLAESICDAFNTYVIPEIVNYNFNNIEEYPKLTVRQIGEQGDLRTMSYALRNVIGAGVVRPDDELEAHIRKLMDLPPADITTLRVVAAPQAGVASSTVPNSTPGAGAAGQKAPEGQLPNAETGKSGTPVVPETGPEASQTTGKADPNKDVPGMPRQTPLPAVGVGGKKVGDGK